MTAKNNFDLIVVGAGPAGSAAILFAKKYNLKTLLLDKDVFPRDKICGDAISGKAMSILFELGLLDEAKKLPMAKINSIIFGSPKNHQVNIELRDNVEKGIPAGIAVTREIFDNFLFQKAKAASDECLEGFKVTHIIKENGYVCGLKGKLKNGTDELVFKADVTLGADGYNSILARKTGIYDLDPKHWVVGLRQYYRNVTGTTNQLEIYYTKEAQPGYFWIFPLDNGFANVGIGMLQKTIKDRKINLKTTLQRIIDGVSFKERFKNAEATEQPKGWNLPVASKHRKNHGNGFMLLGDAAGLIDPFTGEGIGNAFYSAKYAVQTTAAAIEQNDFSEKALSRYDELLWARLGNEFAVSTKLQKLGRIQTLLNFIIKKAENSIEVQEVISGMLRNEIPKKQLANPLFYLKLLFT